MPHAKSHPAYRSTAYRVDPFDLQLFAAVMAHGSITAGAQASSLSLAAASARITALEHRVGTALLLRAKAGTTPTDAGRALLRHAHRVLAELDALQGEMAAFAGGLRGSVRLLCNTAAMAEALPAQLGRFLAAHPDIDVELQELSSDAVLDALRRGVADAGIVADHVDTSGLACSEWGTDELVALLPGAGKPGGDALPFAQLLHRPFVGLGAERGLSRFLQQQAARSGRVLLHRVRVSSFEAVLRLVEQGVGVAVLPRSATPTALPTRGLRVQRCALSDAWARRRLLLCRTEQAEHLPGVRALVQALLSGSARVRN